MAAWGISCPGQRVVLWLPAGVVGHVHWYCPGCPWEHGLMIPLGLGCHEQERRRIWYCLCHRADEVEAQVRGPREAELS